MTSQTAVPVSQTPLQALRQRRFLRSSWPWRSLAHTLATPMVAAVVVGPLWLLFLPFFMILVLALEASENAAQNFEVGIAVFLLLLGLAVVGAFGPLVALPTAILERWRLRLIHPRVSGGHRVPRPGLWQWVRTRYTEPGTWRELAYAVLLCMVAPISLIVPVFIAATAVPLVAAPVIVAFDGPMMIFVEFRTPVETIPLVPVGLLLLLALPYSVAAIAGVHGALARILLGTWDADALRAELVEVTRSRARLVDAFEAERRRIERDLHDGAQQRLVALAMQLGLARMDTPHGTPAEAALATAHEQAKQLISEMRELIHGIHPQLLTDRGLPAALPELADRSAVPVAVAVELPHRLPTHIEATAYFAVAEALTNIAKHSDAQRASVTAGLAGDTLAVEVVDNGRGGADPDGGTGLTGLADRISVMDGRMLLSSPPGGPTRLRVELPCLQGPSV